MFSGYGNGVNGTTAGGTQAPNVQFGYWAWTSGDLHLKNGNVMLGDGSVQQETANGLITALLAATNSTANTTLSYDFPN